MWADVGPTWLPAAEAAENAIRTRVNAHAVGSGVRNLLVVGVGPTKGLVCSDRSKRLGSVLVAIPELPGAPVVD